VKSRPRKTAPAPSATSPIKLADSTINDLTAVFKLLADKSRLKIVLALAQDGKMHVSALCDLLRQSQPAVSHHLTLMRMVGLVGYDRAGKHNYYYLAADHLRDLFEQFFADTGNDHKVLQFDDFSVAYRTK
jgi:ArsR family transcriptional regulator